MERRLTQSTPSSCRARTVALLVVACGLLLPGAASAQQDDDTLEGVTVDAVVGWSSDVEPRSNAWTPLTATVSSERVVDGMLEFRSQTARGEQVHRAPIEVSGGAVKQLRHLAPPGFRHAVRMVRGDAATPSSSRAVQQGGGTRVVVGLLAASLPDGLPAVDLAPLDVDARWAAVDPTWLDHGARALASLDTLVLDGAALAALDEGRAAALRRAVGEGLRVVVVSDGDEVDEPAVSAALGAVPANVAAGEGGVLEPSGDAFVRRSDDDRPVAATLPFGRGRVTVAAGGAEAAVAHVAPRADAPGQTVEVGPTRVLDASRDALQGSVGGLPRLAWIAGFVGLFVLVVGPLNGAVLHRIGRRELAWVTVPVITLVFVGGAFATSRSFGDTAGVSARLAWWWGDDGSELVVAAARTAAGGEVDITLPGSGWDVYASGDGAPASVVPTADGVRTTTEVDGFQRSTVVGWRDVEDGPALALDATMDGDVLRVDVRNLTGRRLTAVRLHAATLSRELDDLPPDASTTVEVDTGGRLPTRDPWVQVGFDEFGAVEQPEGLRDLARWGPLAGHPGTVWVSASAGDDRPAPARALGRSTELVADLVAVGTAPEPSGSTVSPYLVQRDLFHVGFGDGWRPSPLALEGSGTAVVRFGLPAATGVGSSQLSWSLDRGVFDGMTGAGGGEGLRTVCETIEEVGEDGEPVVVGEECIEVPVGEVDPDDGDFPPCPDDAVSCAFGPDGWEICFEGGRCEQGAAGEGLAGEGLAGDDPDEADDGVPAPELVELDGSIDFEAWDHVAGRWARLEAVVASGDAVTRLVDHDGVVLLRARGEFFPLDVSGRGLGLAAADGDGA